MTMLLNLVSLAQTSDRKGTKSSYTTEGGTSLLLSEQCLNGHRAESRDIVRNKSRSFRHDRTQHVRPEEQEPNTRIQDLHITCSAREAEKEAPCVAKY